MAADVKRECRCGVPKSLATYILCRRLRILLPAAKLCAKATEGSRASRQRELESGLPPAMGYPPVYCIAMKGIEALTMR